MEWWNAERARTSPSSSVTVTHTSAPADALSMALPTAPWR